jgi:hypothetical protein
MVISNRAADTCCSCSLQLNQDIRYEYKRIDSHLALEGLIVFHEPSKWCENKHSRSNDGVDDHLSAGAKWNVVLRWITFFS